MLIVDRALTGLLGASLLPSTFALIRSLFDDDRGSVESSAATATADIDKSAGHGVVAVPAMAHET